MRDFLFAAALGLTFFGMVFGINRFGTLPATAVSQAAMKDATALQVADTPVIDAGSGLILTINHDDRRIDVRTTNVPGDYLLCLDDWCAVPVEWDQRRGAYLVTMPLHNSTEAPTNPEAVR